MKNLKRIRESKSIGVNELGRMCGMSASYISAIENGVKKNPSMSALEKLARALGIPTEHLLKKTPILDTIDKYVTEKGITMFDLTKATGLSQEYITNLDNIIPDERDYENLKNIGEILGVDLTINLSLQEPPTYDGAVLSPQNDFVKESVIYFGSDKLKTLTNDFNKLNDLGKEEAVKRVSELTEIQKYIDKNTPDSKPVIEDEFYLIAAHDDNLTDEEKDVMNSRIFEKLKSMK